MPFYISDSPFAMFNDKKHGIYSNRGIGVPGIEIYFPISSILALHLLCPLYYEELKLAVNKSSNTRLNLLSLKTMGRNPDLKKIDEELNNIEKAMKPLASRLLSFDSGLPLKCTEDHLKFFNSLQVHNAERFIACCNDKFELMEKN